MKSEKIRDMESVYPNHMPSYTDPIPEFKTTDHDAIRATIKQSELTAYEEYYSCYMEEIRLRRQNPALASAWHQYQVLLSLYR